MTIRITGMNSGLDTESIITELVSAQSAKKNSLVKAQTKLSWKMDAWKTLNSKIYNLYTTTLSNMRMSSAYSQKKTKVSDSSVASVITAADAANGVQTLKINSLAKSGYLTGAQLEGVTAGSKLSDLAGIGEDEAVNLKIKLGNGAEKNIALSGASTVNDVINQLKNAGVNASFDTKNQRIFVSAKETGLAAEFALTAQDADGNTTDNGLKVLSALGILTSEADDDAADGSLSPEFADRLKALNLTLSTEKTQGAATRIEAGDAEIELNGAKFVSTKNSFEINGMTITALKETSGEVTLTTDNDYEKTYDAIKGFLKGYNELMNEMDSLYNAASSKGYEPLTADEKDAMSDSEIEDWEKKIKDSLLRKDSSLNSIASAMQGVMASGIEIKGETYYLSDFGISTLGYFTAAENEKHAYHIDGDADDASTSGKTDKLKAMITNEPETVMRFFQELTSNLYNTMTEKMSSVKDMRSIYKAYNDKQMQSEYDAYTKEIAEQEEALTELQDKWYRKFSAMETALAKLNSKTSAISGLLGG